jgi:hypothetical protein
VTATETKAFLEESLGEKVRESGSITPRAELQIDFRRIQARYVCTANGNASACTRYSLAVSGMDCTFRNGEVCMSLGI